MSFLAAQIQAKIDFMRIENPCAGTGTWTEVIV